MTEEIELSGTHGTTASKADSIRDTGFKKSKGRLGRGVYFWRENPFAELLAKSWWKFETSRKRYAADSNKCCCVICARFKIKVNEYLDLDDKDIKDGLACLCIEKNLGYLTSDIEMAALITAFVKRLETKLDLEFKVIQSTVSTAPKHFVEEYPIKVIGSPSCYVVFCESCIEITNISTYEN